jgi:hypothetical protein
MTSSEQDARALEIIEKYATKEYTISGSDFIVLLSAAQALLMLRKTAMGEVPSNKLSETINRMHKMFIS